VSMDTNDLFLYVSSIAASLSAQSMDSKYITATPLANAIPKVTIRLRVHLL
jgi:hypothetical protein